ncbi:DUF1622 domain-containing protein [Falsiroseomonas sp. CW058]|uniref:DUF1622 domain-containing protein n=1 Tax=Falsiroseomonas sp. CW058 TaxID=3388664 RepID=UPI003D3154BA
MAEHKGLVGTAAEWIAQGLEAAGLAVLVLGALATTLMFLRRGVAQRSWGGAYEGYRADLGRAILLGLELLVAADIAGTVAAPLDLRNIAALAVVVLIRTFLSFSLEVEINGRWPWQGGGRDPGPARRDPPG